ncbi:MAG: UDP-glucose 4-epimerase GalE [Desulfovibrionales bacterium]
MSKILVTGGAGYIGSHTALALNAAGYEVVVYDNLSTGRRDAVLSPSELLVADLKDVVYLDNIMSIENFSAIIHFAASIVVPESVEKPLLYYRNNTVNTALLVELAVKHAIPHFVFSSTAAVYGMPDQGQVTEQTAVNPINPYGRSKLMDEWIIEDTARAHPGFRHVTLRYFNVAGGDPQGRVGQSTPDATHLIKVACQAALGRREQLAIYGTDYPTPDGTGVRDYIHVTDLADVHVQALKFLEAGNRSETLNCGYGHGYSVREIVQTVREVSNSDFQVVEADRRPGDPPQLIADSSRLMRTFGWKPKHDDIRDIVKTALNWERRL